MFNALVAHQSDKAVTCQFEQWDTDQLPDHSVLIKVRYSSINYKDALAVTGRGKILRSFPMVPGIDLAGVVIESKHPNIQPGDNVVLCGGGLGEDYNGGFAEYARVPGEVLVKRPTHLSDWDCMAAGTAGFTAALCTLALQDAGIQPDSGTVIVSGASGGVGSVAVALLAKLGYSVTAISGRPEHHHYLQQLGADTVLPREPFTTAAKPLERQQWAAAVDTVGGHLLAKLLSQIDYGGAVATCGLAGGHELNTTVMPFILRGVKLLGINSTYINHQQRQRAWQLLASTLDHEFWSHISQTIAFKDIPEYSEKLLAGDIRGRIVVDMATP